jgi:hypothetical protein
MAVFWVAALRSLVEAYRHLRCLLLTSQGSISALMMAANATETPVNVSTQHGATTQKTAISSVNYSVKAVRGSGQS